MSSAETTERSRPMPLIARRGGALGGEARVPGDKSISHRALMLAAVAVGETRISGLLEGEDILATAAAIQALGAEAHRDGAGAWRVRGLGVGGLREPDGVLDLGNSGTGARLIAGLVAGHPITAVLTGDASLRRRPMARVIEPLQRMGACIVARDGGRLPMTVVGTHDPVPITYRLPVASAQVKSALLFAGLAAPGETTVVEPQPTRDHSERLLRHFGAEIGVTDDADGGRRVTLVGQPELSGRPLAVPADPSSAAFAAVAALLVPGSRVSLPGLGANPGRTGLYRTLEEMGGALAWRNAREEGGEPVADLTVRAGPLRGVTVPPERVPSMIDEFPILAVAAACAEGTTIMRGVGELRLKESDRLAAVASGLAACGVRVEEGKDELTVHGAGRPPRGGATVAVGLDHRIAMSFLVLGLAAERPIAIDDAHPIETSFPGFAALMRALGANIQTGAAT